MDVQQKANFHILSKNNNTLQEVDIKWFHFFIRNSGYFIFCMLYVYVEIFFKEF